MKYKVVVDFTRFDRNNLVSLLHGASLVCPYTLSSDQSVKIVNNNEDGGIIIDTANNHFLQNLAHYIKVKGGSVTVEA